MERDYTRHDNAEEAISRPGTSADAYAMPSTGGGSRSWQVPDGRDALFPDTERLRPPKLPSPTFVKDKTLDLPPDYFSTSPAAQSRREARPRTTSIGATKESHDITQEPEQAHFPMQGTSQEPAVVPAQMIHPRRIHYPDNLDDHAYKPSHSPNELRLGITGQRDERPAPPTISRTSTGNTDIEGNPSLSGSAHTSDEDDNDIDRDVYDWSDEDDLVEGQEAATEREAALVKDRSFAYRKRRPWSPWRILTFLFTSLLGAVVGVILLVTPPIIINYIYEGNDPDNTKLFIALNVKAWFFFAAFNWTMLWVSHFVVEALPRIVIRITKIVLGMVPEKMTSLLEFYHASKKWLKFLCLASSIWGSWTIIFASIYSLYSFDGNSRQPYTNVIFQLLELLFFAALLLYIEKLLMQIIAIRFHRTAYAERIKEASLALSVLDKLKFYRPPTSKRPRTSYFRGSALSTPNIGPKSASQGNSPNLGASSGGYFGSHPARGSSSPDDEKKRSNREAVLGGPPERPLHTRTISENLIPITAKVGQVFKTAVDLDPLAYFNQRSALDATSPHAAKKLARNLYYTLRQDPHRDYLIVADFDPIFPKAKDSQEAFAIFDRDGNGDISRSEMKTSVLRIYKERRLLSRGLQDVGSAVAKLDRIFIVAGVIVLFFIALQIFHVDISKSLTTFYTLGIGASFIFKNLAQQVFDSVMFVFVTHPFDTGDKVIIQKADVQDIVSVKQMGLLSTVFVRVDGSEMYVANSILNQLLITNIRRSNNQGENATIQIDWATPEWKIDELEKRMNDWLQNDTRAYEPSTAATYQHVDYTNSLTITFWMCLKGTWQDWGGRWKHRTAFHAALAHFIKELGISYAYYPQRIAYWNDAVQSGSSRHRHAERSGSDTSGPSSGSPPPPPFRPRLDSMAKKDDSSQDNSMPRPGREDSNLTLHENDSGHSSHETAVSGPPASLGPIMEQQPTSTGSALDRHRSLLGFRAPIHNTVRRPREGSSAKRRVGFEQKNWSMGDGTGGS